MDVVTASLNVQTTRLHHVRHSTGMIHQRYNTCLSTETSTLRPQASSSCLVRPHSWISERIRIYPKRARQFKSLMIVLGRVFSYCWNSPCLHPANWLLNLDEPQFPRIFAHCIRECLRNQMACIITAIAQVKVLRKWMKLLVPAHKSESFSGIRKHVVIGEWPGGNLKRQKSVDKYREWFSAVSR